MRDYLVLYINGERHKIPGEFFSINLSSFLREQLGLVGTKVVCSEGDCGACTVLKYRPGVDKLPEAINSCIAPLVSLDGHHIFTIESVRQEGQLNDLQSSMVCEQGAQCGFCTPGIVMSLTSMGEHESKINEQKIKNYLVGNLCRCTGYRPILNAALKVDFKKVTPLLSRYHTKEIDGELKKVSQQSFVFVDERGSVCAPVDLNETCEFLSKNSPVTLFSAGTDLGVVFNKKGKQNIKWLSLHQVAELYQHKESSSEYFFGAKVSLEKVREICKKDFEEFADFLNLFASPQIKNIGTLVGNVANASPIADTIPFLCVAGACVYLKSDSGERTVNLWDFYKGYKQIDCAPNELITGISLPKKSSAYKFKLYKTSTRKDLDISTVNFAVKYRLDGKQLSQVQLALGGVAATVFRPSKTESMLQSAPISKELIDKTTAGLAGEVNPLSDLRGSAWLRKLLCQNLLRKFFHEVSNEA